MRLAVLIRAVLGVVELTFPSTLVAHHHPDVITLRAIRILGVRDLAQAGITVARPTPRVIRWCAAVDGLHAGSMLALGALDADRRRISWSSAAVAMAFTVVEWRAHDIQRSSWPSP